MTVTWPIYVIYLKPEAHCPDHIKALRSVLKRALRDHGMRCITIQTTNSKGADQFKPGSTYLSRLADARDTVLPDIFPDCRLNRSMQHRR